MTKKIKSETMCSSLWNHQIIDSTGRVKPCCRFLEDFRPKHHNLNFYTIEEIFNSDFMKNLRERSLNGETIEGCQRCYEEELGGKKSLRQRINDHPSIGLKTLDIDNPRITNIELAISNDCNLMCRMCDSRYSHKLYDEEVEFLGYPISDSKHTRTNIDFTREILSDLKFIKFTGGEPLMIKEQWSLLEDAVKQGVAKNITLNYSTNCTIFPKQQHIDLWKEFKHIELATSIDSIVKEENEYQRYLTNHDTVITNFLKYVDLKSKVNLDLISRPTITILNIFHAPETLEWLEQYCTKVNPTHVTFPKHLSLTILPTIDKNKIVEKFKNYQYKTESSKISCQYLISYMLSVDNQHLLELFKNHTKFLDNKRNQNFKEIYSYYSFC
jgi:radical SAM protein with 4Fe4S-binding SPASM domain